MFNVGQACQNAIDALRMDWTRRATSHFIWRGFGEAAAKSAAEKLWKIASLDIEPEEAVDELLDNGCAE